MCVIYSSLGISLCSYSTNTFRLILFKCIIKPYMIEKTIDYGCFNHIWFYYGIIATFLAKKF